MAPLLLRNCSKQALTVLYEPNKSIDTTDLNALAERWLKSLKKLPAAPAITKSMRPNSATVFSTALTIDLTSLTSTPPQAITLEPARKLWMSAAASSVFFSLRPTIAALAPKRTSASV